MTDISSWLRIENADGDIVFEAMHWGTDEWECRTIPNTERNMVDTLGEMLINATLVALRTPDAVITGYYARRIGLILQDIGLDMVD